MHYVDWLAEKRICRTVMSAIWQGKLRHTEQKELAAILRLPPSYLSGMFGWQTGIDPIAANSLGTTKGDGTHFGVKGLASESQFARITEHLQDPHRSAIAELYSTLNGSHVPAVPTAPPDRLSELAIDESVSSIERAVDKIHRLWGEADLNVDPLEVRVRMEELNIGISYLLGSPILNPTTKYPLVVAELCIQKSSVDAVVGRPWDTLRHAIIARRIVELFSFQNNRKGPEVLHFMALALEAEAMGFSNLGVRGAALSRAERSKDYLDEMERKYPLERARAWVLASHFNHSARARRFSLKFGDRDLDELLSVANSEFGGNGRLWEAYRFQIELTLVRAYVKNGSKRKTTEKLLDQLRYEVEMEDTRVASLRQTMFYRTLARYSQVVDDKDTFDLALTNAINIATVASFEHQIASIREEFGSEVGEVAEERP